MKLKTPDDYELRAAVGSVEIREHEDGSATISGFAALFDTLSQNLGGFREIIAKGAFDDTDLSDVRGLFNHDQNYVLGRTGPGTLRTEIKKRGLKYTIDLPNTQTIRDLVLEPIKRGDISQSSFGFIVGRGNDVWDEDDDGVLIRTINRFKRILDVSPVVFPAYVDTTVAARGIQARSDAAAQHVEVIEQHKARGRIADSLARRATLSGLQL